MQAIFTYGGNRKSAVTPRTILFGATWNSAYVFKATSTLGPLPYPPENVLALVSPWSSADVLAPRTASELQAAMQKFSAYVAANDAYLDSARKFYDAYASQSGSMGDIAARFKTRIVDMAILSQGVQDAKAILQRVNAQIGVILKSKATASLPALPSSSTLEAASVASAPSGFSSSSLLIPVGAALAALFVLKGH